MFSKLLLSLLLVLGVVALIVFAHDNPSYSVGEPTAVVRAWLDKTAASADNSTLETWDEEYVGGGKWVVSRYREDHSGDWFDRWRLADLNNLREYTNDLPTEDLSTFRQGLWTTDHSDDLYESRSWYLYEKSGLIVERDEEAESKDQ